VTSQNPTCIGFDVRVRSRIPEHKVRVTAPDVGGGFGSKIFLYNEETVCTWASREIKRPIRWTAERTELVTDAHGRDHITDAEMAMSKTARSSASG
jgi:carbon-monoxide dehydrogenase large subunit